jgi:hypothetical protein
MNSPPNVLPPVPDPPSPHEPAILRAIGNGMDRTALRLDGRWSESEVDSVLAAYGLVATPGGSIVRASAVLPTADGLAGGAADHHVRQAASRVEAAHLQLARVQARQYARAAADRSAGEYRTRLLAWRARLEQLPRDADRELQRIDNSRVPNTA